MLHIRRRPEPTARWAARGWPPLLRWTDRPEVPLLFWALNELTDAAQADDVDVVEDLLSEAGILLERIWTDPPAGAHRRDVMSISTGLWAEVQRGRGITDLTQVALHARLLRNLVTPVGSQLPVRPIMAVPAYRDPGERIAGGHLPLAAAAGLHGREVHEQFLLLLATVLSNGGGHLVDHATCRVPHGADPIRTGWNRPGGGPAGTLLGGVRTGQRRGSGDLVLRPGPCLTAVRRQGRTRAVAGADEWSIDDIGWALAGAWLTDTTLIIQPDQISRSHTTAMPVVADHRVEQVWRMPLAVFHPKQFMPPQQRWPRTTATLRPIPDH